MLSCWAAQYKREATDGIAKTAAGPARVRLALVPGAGGCPFFFLGRCRSSAAEADADAGGHGTSHVFTAAASNFTTTTRRFTLSET